MALSYCHVDGTGAGDESGDDWANKMPFSKFYTGEAKSWDNVAAGFTYFFMGGQTYTLTASIVTAVDGTEADRITIVGVASGTTREGAAMDSADFAQGADRPILDGGASYNVDLSDYSGVENCDIESAVGVMLFDATCRLVNCKVCNDTTGSATRVLVTCASAYLSVINCELTSDEAGTASIYGFTCTNTCTAVFCYIHDITTGTSIAISPYGTIMISLFCIFDNIDIGMSGTSDEGGLFFGCTFYDCDEALKFNDGYGGLVLNCIFSDCTTSAISTDAAMNSYVLMYNHFYNNGDDHLNIPEEGDTPDLFCDWWKTTGDPKFTTAGSDFSLQSDSPCIDAGMAMALGVG